MQISLKIMIRFKRVRFVLATVLLMTSSTAFADICSLVTKTYSDCQLSAMCSHCVTTSGCKYNQEDGTCISVSAASNLSSAITFCTSNDSVCASCTTSSSKQLCTGEDGSCMCLSLCDVVSSDNCTTEVTDSSSNNSQGFSMVYAAVAFGGLCIVIVLFVQRKCTENNRYVQQVGETTQQQRRQEVERYRQRRPELALNLESWRDHVTLHKSQLAKVELEPCFYLMMEGEKKNSSPWNSGSIREVNIAIDAFHSPISSGISDPMSFQGSWPMAAPYAAMREEYPSNTTTDGSDSGSEIASIADEDEEKSEVVINGERCTGRR